MSKWVNMPKTIYDEDFIQPEELYQRLIDIQNKYGKDNEDGHEPMDNLLCECLEGLGYEKAIEIFKSQRRWYS